MSSAGITIWPEGTCLLTQLKKELVTCEASQLHSMLVVLPTQRLATCLSGMLASHFGACLPPLMQTWESFLSGQVPLLSTEGGRIWTEISDHAFELILVSLIREGCFRHLHPGHAHELCQFFSDLEEFDMGDPEMEALNERLREDYYRDQQHIAHLNARIDEIRRLLVAVGEAMQASGFVTRSGALKIRGQELLRRCNQGEWPSFSHLYFAGFTTVRRFFRPVLRRLAESERVSLWFVQPPQVLSQVNPLKELIDDIRKTAHRCRELGSSASAISSAGEDITSRIGIHSCGSWTDEIAHALRQAEIYIRQGCPPSQIAILLTNEDRYGKVIRTLLQESGRDANVAIATSLSQNLIGSWLGALFGYFEADTSAEWRSCLAFLSHKISLNILSRAMMSGTEAGMVTEEQCVLLSEALLSVLKGAGASVPDLACLADASEDEAISRALRRLSALMAPLWSFRSVRASGHSIRQSLKSWTILLESLLDQAGIWTLPEEDRENTLLGAGVQALSGLLDSFVEAGSVTASQLSAAEFITLLKEKIRSCETRSIGYPLKGLQILGLTEARFVPFQVVMILGCLEGEFPRALPGDLLMDEWLKSRLGLPGWQYVEALEDTTFQLLQSRITRLELFFPREQEDIPAVRSRFIEKLCHRYPELIVRSPGDEGFRSIFPSDAGQANVKSSAAVPDLRLRCPERLLSGVDAGLLESLMQCPWKFYLDQSFGRGSGALVGAAEVMEGQLLHRVLEIFFRGGRVGRGLTLSRLPASIREDEWDGMAVERLRRITESIFPAQPELWPLRQHLCVFAWPALAESMKACFRQDHSSVLQFPSVWLCEWSFGQGEGVLVESRRLFGREHPLLDARLPGVCIRGVIDRVDCHQGRVMISDYKRRTVPSPSAVLQAVKPQLPLYLLAFCADPVHGLEVKEKSSSLTYWNILDGKIYPVCVPDSEISGGSRASAPVATEAAIGQLRALWYEKVISLLEGQRAVLPVPGDACRYCRWSGVCRKHDPGVLPLLKKSSSTHTSYGER